MSGDQLDRRGADLLVVGCERHAGDLERAAVATCSNLDRRGDDLHGNAREGDPGRGRPIRRSHPAARFELRRAGGPGPSGHLGRVRLQSARSIAKGGGRVDAAYADHGGGARVADRYDPAENIRGGVAYLSRLLRQYGGNEELALAAYNAGPQAVERYGNDVPPYRETQDYVRRVRTATLGTTTRSKTPIYRSLDIVNGRPIPRYSNVTPPTGEPPTTAGQE